jgi:hypothetical protein
MRTFTRRIAKLENRFGVTNHLDALVVVARAGWCLALDRDTCIGILRESGFLPARVGGVHSVHLAGVPLGLSPEEPKRYLRENGAKICSPRTPVASALSQPAKENR